MESSNFCIWNYPYDFSSKCLCKRRSIHDEPNYDDLDVCMLRSEFERFKKLFLSDEKYDLLSTESHGDYPYFFF